LTVCFLRPDDFVRLIFRLARLQEIFPRFPAGAGHGLVGAAEGEGIMLTVGRRFDALIGLGLIILSACAYLEADKMPTARRGIGPGDYPKFVSVGLIGLGVILAVKSLVVRPNDGKPLFSLSAWAVFRTLFFVAATFLYIQSLRFLGFVLASMLYQGVVVPFFGYRRHLVTAVSSFAIPLVIYLVFRYVFLVLIPTGDVFRILD
jgi:hypothetical protein